MFQVLTEDSIKVCLDLVALSQHRSVAMWGDIAHLPLSLLFAPLSAPPSTCLSPCLCWFFSCLFPCLPLSVCSLYVTAVGFLLWPTACLHMLQSITFTTISCTCMSLCWQPQWYVQPHSLPTFSLQPHIYTPLPPAPCIHAPPFSQQ